MFDQSKNPYLTALRGSVAILAICLFLALTLGQEWDCSEADPVFGGCEVTTTRTVSGAESAETFFFTLTLLGLPFAIAAARRIRARSAER